MDGADVTDPYGGDIFAVNINYDAVQEVEVKALGAEAADGSSMVGQFMNIVTKSGGEVGPGKVAFFIISQVLNAGNLVVDGAKQIQELQTHPALGGHDSEENSARFVSDWGY